MRFSPGLVRHDGNASLFRAVEMSILATLAGSPLHVHAEGLRGTGKTTILRAARHVLPRIRRIRGCLYNCDPDAPHCPLHRDRGPWETEWVPMPFVEISQSAKVGTVVGSVDLARLTDPTRPEAALLPGSIPQAHRGIIFVDEINRLADTAPELADVLLDVMGTRPGRIQIEETGLPRVELPVNIAVWAASNPDEDPGPLEDIRKQLSDRFDFVVAMARPGRVEVVAEILARRDERAHPPCPEPGPTWEELLDRFRRISVSGLLQRLVASLYVDFSLESLRSVEAIQLGARTHGALEGRDRVALRDVLAVTPLALHHRADLATVTEIMKHLEEWENRSTSEQPPAGGQAPEEQSTVAGKQTGCEPAAPPAAARDQFARPWAGLFERLRRGFEGRPAKDTEHRAPHGRTSGWAGAESPGAARGMVERPGRGRGMTLPGQVADPLQVAPFAPPLPARPLVELGPDEMVRFPDPAP